MPKNQRIIEKAVGINEETNQLIWDRIYSLKELQLDDRIRIYEDKNSKDSNECIVDGYINKLPKNDSNLNITELEVETINNRNTRLEQEKLAALSKDIHQKNSNAAFLYKRRN